MIFATSTRVAKALLEQLTKPHRIPSSCDCLIKTWAINSIICENSALFMEKDSTGIVHTNHLKDENRIAADLAPLKSVAKELNRQFPLIGFTQDQSFRLSDIAFDIGQTVSVPDEVADQATA